MLPSQLITGHCACLSSSASPSRPSRPSPVHGLYVLASVIRLIPTATTYILASCTRVPSLRDELVVVAVANLARAAGFPTKTRNVTVARGRQRDDVEIQRLCVAGHANLVIDVTIVHEMSGSCTGEVVTYPRIRIIVALICFEDRV